MSRIERAFWLFTAISCFIAGVILFVMFFGFMLGLFGVGMYYAGENAFRFIYSLLAFSVTAFLVVIVGATGISCFIDECRDIWKGDY